MIGRRIPGLGLLSTAAAIVSVGALATNVIAGALPQRGEGMAASTFKVFRTVYAPVMQLLWHSRRTTRPVSSEW